MRFHALEEKESIMATQAQPLNPRLMFKEIFFIFT